MAASRRVHLRQLAWPRAPAYVLAVGYRLAIVGEHGRPRNRNRIRAIQQRIGAVTCPPNEWRSQRVVGDVAEGVVLRGLDVVGDASQMWNRVGVVDEGVSG